MSPPPDPPRRTGLGAVLLRIAALVVLAVAATWASHLIREALDLQIMPRNEQEVHRMIMLGALAYIGLLALPFVPGAEIGIAMVTAFGAAIAPLVYAATVVAMMLSYTVGKLLPAAMLARLLGFFRMRRAARLVARAAARPADDRLALLLDQAPPGAAAFALRHRYIALALVVNLPGNAILGGGGGIMLVSGMSGIFAPLPTLVTVLLAVSPVPVAVWFFGA